MSEVPLTVGNEHTIRVEETAGRQIVYVASALGLGRSAELHRMLTAALEQRRATVLDVSAVTDLDLCGMQLLCSACHTFLDRDVPFGWQGRLSWSCEKAGVAGFESGRPACRRSGNRDCLWKQA